MSGMFTPTLHEQIRCVDREITMRRMVYAKRIAEKKMTQRKAQDEIALMEAVKATLEMLANHGMQRVVGGIEP